MARRAPLTKNREARLFVRKRETGGRHRWQSGSSGRRAKSRSSATPVGVHAEWIDRMFKEKDIVCLVSDPSKTDVVMSVSGAGTDVQYSVFLDGQIRTFFEEQLRSVAVSKANWVDRQTFRSYLTSSLINTPSAKNLYSLNAARIDYVPYQFRPALKILKADDPRILIADSVVRRHVEMLKKHQEVGFTCILLKPVAVDKLRDIVK